MHLDIVLRVEAGKRVRETLGGPTGGAEERADDTRTIRGMERELVEVDHPTREESDSRGDQGQRDQ